MKVIDLLNKIANGEIHYSRKFRFPYEEYCTATQFFERYIVDKDSLNMEIKELEDTPKEDKKIEKLEKLHQVSNKRQQMNNYILKDKINEIIDYLKSKGE